MKQIFKLFLTLSVLLFTFSCQKRQPTHSTAWNSSGNNMVRVQSYDNNGNLMEYFMAYSLFNSLYNNGGYGAVNNYYVQHRSDFDRSYNNYHRQYSYSANPKIKTVPIQNSSYSSSYRKSSPSRSSNSSSSIFKSSSPSRSSSSSFSSYRSSSPSRSSFSGSSFRSSSSSFRSSSSSSFRSSSPSRGR